MRQLRAVKLLFSRRATRRLREIADYIHREDPAAARRVQKAIRDACTLIADFPQSGRMVGLRVRRFVVPRLPHPVYYQADDLADTVTVITIRHAARRPLP